MLRVWLFCVVGLFGAASASAEPDAYQLWRAKLFDTLAQTKDANDYLALYLLSGHETGGEYFLRRAYTTGGGNAKALWTAAIALPCPGECEQSTAAAHDLVKADPGNALAWLTLAYVLERDSGITKEVTEALKQAAKASRLHDYGFDLMRTMITAVGRVPASAAAIAAAPSRPGSVEEFQLGHGDGSVTVGSHVIIEWIEHGCTSHGATLDDATVAACASARDNRKLGDSLAILPPDSDAGRQLREQVHAILVADNTGSAKTRLELYAASNNEREFTARLAHSLAH